MNKGDLIKECGQDIAKIEIAKKISHEIESYKNEKNETTKAKIIKLINDREKVYSNDIETIKRYCIDK